MIQEEKLLSLINRSKRLIAKLKKTTVGNLVNRVEALENKNSHLENSLTSLQNKFNTLEDRLKNYEKHTHNLEDSIINDTSNGSGDMFEITKATKGVN